MNKLIFLLLIPIIIILTYLVWFVISAFINWGCYNDEVWRY